jgi:hypothetical protein
MVNQRPWISIPLRKLGGPSSIRIVDGLALDITQFMHPFPNVIAVLVELLTLQ